MAGALAMQSEAWPALGPLCGLPHMCPAFTCPGEGKCYGGSSESPLACALTAVSRVPWLFAGTRLRKRRLCWPVAFCRFHLFTRPPGQAPCGPGTQQAVGRHFPSGEPSKDKMINYSRWLRKSSGVVRAQRKMQGRLPGGNALSS